MNATWGSLSRFIMKRTKLMIPGHKPCFGVTCARWRGWALLSALMEICGILEFRSGICEAIMMRSFGTKLIPWAGFLTKQYHEAGKTGPTKFGVFSFPDMSLVHM